MKDCFEGGSFRIVIIAFTSQAMYVIGCDIHSSDLRDAVVPFKTLLMSFISLNNTELGFSILDATLSVYFGDWTQRDLFEKESAALDGKVSLEVFTLNGLF